MHKKQKHLYVGGDLHKQYHVAVIINCWQEKLAELTVENKPSAFSTFLLDIYKMMEEGLTPVFGLEDVGGYGQSLAQFLTDHGKVVKEVNPALSYTERKSHMTTQKSDSWDAECVARILLNKLNHLPDAKPHDLFWSIQQLVTRRNALVKAQGALKNQLHIQLGHHYPRIKDHVFNNSHIKDYGVGRFDPDYELAQAWQRLMDGKQVDSDIQLLHHEIFESKFEGIFQTNYRTAHDKTIESGRPWNWEKNYEE